MCVSLVEGPTLESIDLQTSFWYIGTSSDHLGQGPVSRSWGQGQGRSSVTKHTFAFDLFQFLPRDAMLARY